MLTESQDINLEPPKHLAKDIDLERYSGKWYVVSHLPFESEPKHNESEFYSLRPDGTIDIDFEFSKDEAGKEKRVVKQTMWPLNKEHNMMRHRIGETTIDYGIVDIDDNYQWAVIGTLDKKHCWIMSRKPKIDPQVKERMLDKLNILGFETSKIEDVCQKAE